MSQSLEPRERETRKRVSLLAHNGGQIVKCLIFKNIWKHSEIWKCASLSIQELPLNNANERNFVAKVEESQWLCWQPEPCEDINSRKCRKIAKSKFNAAKECENNILNQPVRISLWWRRRQVALAFRGLQISFSLSLLLFLAAALAALLRFSASVFCSSSRNHRDFRISLCLAVHALKFMAWTVSRRSENVELFATSKRVSNLSSPKRWFGFGNSDSVIVCVIHTVYANTNGIINRTDLWPMKKLVESF